MTDIGQYRSRLKSKLYNELRSVLQRVLELGAQLKPMVRCLLLSENCGSVDVGRPL
jgi:hypothetical protein